MCVCVNTHTHTHTHTHIYIYIYVCVCVCVCTHNKYKLNTFSVGKHTDIILNIRCEGIDPNYLGFTLSQACHNVTNIENREEHDTVQILHTIN